MNLFIFEQIISRVGRELLLEYEKCVDELFQLKVLKFNNRKLKIKIKKKILFIFKSQLGLIITVSPQSE